MHSILTVMLTIIHTLTMTSMHTVTITAPSTHMMTSTRTIMLTALPPVARMTTIIIITMALAAIRMFPTAI
jgi:hypothetical protein